NGWQLSDATSTTTLKKYQLLPNTYLILCANADTSLFSNYGPTMGLASWPSLNNSSDIIKITDSIGNLIDSVAYTDLWYADDVKNDGGFTLELIRPNDSCAAYNQKWRASNHPDGGTPGNQNSIYS